MFLSWTFNNFLQSFLYKLYYIKKNHLKHFIKHVKNQNPCYYTLRECLATERINKNAQMVELYRVADVFLKCTR